MMKMAMETKVASAKKEKCCGGIIIKEKKVLVVWQSNEINEICCFPKGHMEQGETEIETAEREIMEETGIRAELDESKRVELFYHIEPDNIDKTVVLFVGKPIGGAETTPQEGEINEAKWVIMEEVENVLVRDAWKNAWREARKMIKEE